MPSREKETQKEKQDGEEVGGRNRESIRCPIVLEGTLSPHFDKWGLG